VLVWGDNLKVQWMIQELTLPLPVAGCYACWHSNKMEDR
jgi:hypothetical protein